MGREPTRATARLKALEEDLKRHHLISKDRRTIGDYPHGQLLAQLFHEGLQGEASLSAQEYPDPTFRRHIDLVLDKLWAVMLLDGLVETRSRWDLEQKLENIAAEEDRFDEAPDPEFWDAFDGGRPTIYDPMDPAYQKLCSDRTYQMIAEKSRPARPHVQEPAN